MTYSLPRRLVAEWLGTMLLVCTVVGSGIMADQLTDDVALALLGNTIPTGAILVVLITILGPLSGAHFNPAVTLAIALTKRFAPCEIMPYVAAQITGAIAGSLLAHGMFDLDIIQISEKVRTGPNQWLAEITATFGLVAVIFGALKVAQGAIPWLVGLYITAAYWFTASTSFANPAVAIGRAFSDTFAGIRPADLPGFIIAQLVGAALAALVIGWLFKPDHISGD